MRNDIMEQITFPNGDYYEGEFADGRVKEGKWQDDKFVGK